MSRKLNYNIFKYLLYAFIFTKHLGYTFEDDGLDMYREDDMFFEFLQLVYSKYCPPLSKSGNQVVRFVRGIQLTEVPELFFIVHYVSKYYYSNFKICIIENHSLGIVFGMSVNP